MRIALTSCRSYDRESFTEASRGQDFALEFHEARLEPATAGMVAGCEAVCIFVNDDAGAPVLERLVAGGTRLLLLRSAGYNHVDLDAARALGLAVAHVPRYSPHAVAEHACALLLTLARGTHRAWTRVREGNFLLDGLVGFNIHGRTVGVVGTGAIGTVFAGIMHGFGASVIATDPVSRAAADIARYVELDELLGTADIVSLHCPLTAQTRHLLDAPALARMKPGAVLINTGRGALVDTPALIAALKQRRLGAVGLDVYEEEQGLFFHDLSQRGIDDDVLARLLTFPNVLVTAHQGFLTREALDGIARTTLGNAAAWRDGGRPLHPLGS
ncbi:MAG: 2-hydroxyacid dehydrogenase [Pseudomonadota bacterium]